MRYLKIFLIAIFTLCLALFAQKKTDGFTKASITPHHPFDPRWEITPLSAAALGEVQYVLGQSFTYLGCGGQSHIFESSDGKYVIKFFKQRVFEMPLWVEYGPFTQYRDKKRLKRIDKKERDFTSYKVSLEELQGETGVIFVHLNPSQDLQKKLVIQDNLHIQHEIDLDHMDFIIQRKGELSLERISRLMQEGNVDSAKRSVESLLDLIVIRSKKGFHDRDPNIRTNCGFLGEYAIKIDVGRFVKIEKMKDPKVYTQEVIRIGAPFRKWLEETYPELVSASDAKMRALLEEYHGL